MKSLEELQKELEREELTPQEYIDVFKEYLAAIAEDRVTYTRTTAALTGVVKELLGFYVHCKELKLNPEDFKVQTFNLVPSPEGGYSFSFTGAMPNVKPQS